MGSDFLTARMGEWDLSTNWDITTAHNLTLSTVNPYDYIRAAAMHRDRNFLMAVNNGGWVTTYVFPVPGTYTSSAWDSNTVLASGVSYSNGLDVSPDGTKLFTIDRYNLILREFTVTA